MMCSFTVELVSTVKKITITALPPDKDKCVTVLLDNTGDPALPMGLQLRPLFLVPSDVELIKNDRRNVFPIPADCSHIEVEVTHNRAAGRYRTFYLGLRVIATTSTGTDVWHFDAGPKKTE